MTAASDHPEIVRRTQVIDLARSVPLGVILPLETSVFLTIAIKHFDARLRVMQAIALTGRIVVARPRRAGLALVEVL